MPHATTQHDAPSPPASRGRGRTRRGQSLADMLAQWGPDADPAAPSLDEARRTVRALALGHYENFPVLSRLVPDDLRDDFAAVYAFCRWSDDLADETGADDAARARSLELLAWWRAGLRACAAHARGDAQDPPRHPVYVALAQTMRARELDEAPFHHLLDAFEQDQRIIRYETWAQLMGYCEGSANPVGRIVLALAGHTGAKPGDDERLAMSDATCTALQLANFWQDVRRDLLERGRVYMPSAETGIDATTLRAWSHRDDDPNARVRFIRALRPLVCRTRELFVQGRPLVRTLDARIRPVVWLFGAGGERILTKVERAGCTTLWARPRLTGVEKGALVARAAAGLYPGARA
ncbi:MAG: squalene synthase HpnC [Phycisphaerales bacterium]|nr:MAG: squalene synthase HpnC [Phycisphaerales bacterium]